MIRHGTEGSLARAVQFRTPFSGTSVLFVISCGVLVFAASYVDNVDEWAALSILPVMLVLVLPVCITCWVIMLKRRERPWWLVLAAILWSLAWMFHQRPHGLWTYWAARQARKVFFQTAN